MHTEFHNHHIYEYCLDTYIEQFWYSVPSLELISHKRADIMPSVAVERQSAMKWQQNTFKF